MRRQLGTLGTTFDAVLDGEVVGMFEVDDDLTRGGTKLGAAGWADECNHRVREDRRDGGSGPGWSARGGVATLGARPEGGHGWPSGTSGAVGALYRLKVPGEG
jgi:hypothetical protein